jgi:hypothetical protein
MEIDADIGNHPFEVTLSSDDTRKMLMFSKTA